MSPDSKPTAAKPNTADGTQEPYQDEPVPSYETALQQGAGGGIGAGPSSSAAPTQPAPQCHPAYGCSPYTSHGTARIVIVPAPHFHSQQHHPLMHPGHPQAQTLLPMPASMQTTPGPRALPRFWSAFFQGFLIYILINLLVDLAMTSKW